VNNFLLANKDSLVVTDKICIKSSSEFDASENGSIESVSHLM
jgi:hypothetical protein